MEFFNASLSCNCSKISLGVGGRTLLEELEELLEEIFEELEELLELLLEEELEEEVEELLTLDSLLDVEEITLEVVSTLEVEETLLPLLPKAGFEQAVSTNNEINGNSFFILSVLINDAYL